MSKKKKMTTEEKKLKSKDTIADLVRAINEEHGGEVVKVASDESLIPKYLPTPFPSLNSLMKGLPLGRFLTVAGPSKCGKTALLYQIIAKHQADNLEAIAVWLDFENSYDPEWATKLGVDLSRLMVLKYQIETVESMEPVLDRLVTILRKHVVMLVVMDSIGAMVPKGDIVDKKGDRSFSKDNMLNLQTKLGEIYRKLNTLIASTREFPGVCVAMIGHVYQVPNKQGLHITEIRGGNALKHWSTQILEMKRGPRDDGPDPVKVIAPDGSTQTIRPGFAVKLKLGKSKVNENESQEIQMRFYTGRGFDFVRSTVTAALALGIIEGKGWYKSSLLPDGRMQGADNVLKFFEENADAYSKLAGLVDQQSAEKPTETKETSNHEHQEN